MKLPELYGIDAPCVAAPQAGLVAQVQGASCMSQLGDAVQGVCVWVRIPHSHLDCVAAGAWCDRVFPGGLVAL